MSEKWWDMSDDELDDLFREASDKVDVPFDSSAYNKLRQKIAEQPMSESPRGFKKRWLFLLAGLFFMVGVGLVYRFGSDLKENNLTKNVTNNGKKNTVKPLNSPLSASPSPLPVSSSPLPVSSSPLPVSSSPLSVSPQTTGKTHTTTKSFLKSPEINSQKVTDNAKLKKLSVGIQTTEESSVRTHITAEQTTEESSVRTQTTAKEIINNTKLRQSSVRIQTTAEENSDSLNTSKEIVENKPVISPLRDSETYDIVQNKVIENINFNSYNTKNKLVKFNNAKNNKDREGKNEPLNSQFIQQNTSIILGNSTSLQEKPVSEETISKTNFYNVDFLKNKVSKSLSTDIHAELPDYVDSLPRTIKPVKFSKLGIRLAFSPDFNSIDNLSKMALGGSVGLLLEYKISKKLVLQTGIVYSSKSYVGSFDDYLNWKDWKSYHPSKPTQVDGGCKVFDIPINVRLNLFQKPKQTWFISSGVSSYWMMNENYTYNYAWGSPREVGWNDNSKYYFSVLNFSVGLEKQISKRFSLQIEPYLKTPLKNVGRGGVNLYSSGVLFSTKYEF